MHDMMLSPNAFWRQLLPPGALIDLSCSAGRPGIVAGVVLERPIEIQLICVGYINLRESIATSCTVVMGPSSGTETFRRRTKLCSLGFGSLEDDLDLECSFSSLAFRPTAWPAASFVVSGLFLPADPIDNFSLEGNKWSFRDPDG